MSRPDWDKYFLKIVEDVGSCVSCTRGKCGAIFVKDNRILATGYAGSPPGFKHCLEAGDQIEEKCRVLQSAGFRGHAEITHEGVKYTWNDEKKRYETPIKQSCVRTCHAEMNGIIQAAKYGVSLTDSKLYVSMTPCRTCALALISVGVKEIICAQKYHSGEESEYMFEIANIPITFMDEGIVKY